MCSIKNPNTMYHLHVRGSAYCSEQKLCDDTWTVSINGKTKSNLVTWQLIRPLVCVGQVQSMDTKALLRVKRLWKYNQLLAQDWKTTLGTLILKGKTRSRPISTKHLELSNVSSMQLARRLLEEALLPKMFGRYSRISWKGKNLIPRFICWPLSTQPSYKKDLL